MMSFQSRARGLRPRPRHADTASAHESAPAEPPEPNVAEAHGGAANDNLPGWHASSMDLRDGLEVTEHDSLDTLPSEWADTQAP